MPSSQLDEGRDYGVADRLLALRKRGGLTQRELGALLGVSEKAVAAWEAGLSYPAVERLGPLVTLYVERGVFAAGREEEEAAALWEGVRARAPRRIPAFDPHWFAALQGMEHAASPSPDPPSLPIAADLRPRRHDWGEAPAVPIMQGRATELATLSEWVRDEGCHVVQVLGVGGIGKTTLATHVARDLAPAFATVYWRSLRNAPPVEEWLAGAIAALSAGQTVTPAGLDAQLRLLLELLRAERALLVLDNLETVLEPGAPTTRYREGYAGYGEALRRLAEGMHAGSLLLTSREQPLQADDEVVRALQLGGLEVTEGRALLSRRALAGDVAAWRALVDRYGGNPLALRIVGETIGTVFGGDIAAFLAQETTVFGGIRQLLDTQVERLSALERMILTVLAVEREPVAFAAIVAALGSEMDRADMVEAVEALRRRSLLEWGPGGAFTLQPVVLEHGTRRLIEAVADEIAVGAPRLLVQVALVKATAKDYVRRSQERLIAQPLLDRARGRLGSAEAVDERLLALLDRWRGRPAAEQGCGPGNVFNLLRLLRGDARRLDLSRLVVRHAYLQDVDAQDANLAGGHLSEAVLTEAFTYPVSFALSADGAYLAVGTATGEVRLWQVEDRTLVLSIQAHRGLVRGLALSGDGHLMASCSPGGTVKLWETASGQLRATVQGHSSGIRGVALSADGRLLASGHVDGTLGLWAAEDGRRLATLPGDCGEIWGVALSGDGRLLAGGSADGTVTLWETVSGQLQATLRGHTAAVWGVALSGNGRLLASGSADGTVTLWETASGQLQATLHGHGGGVMGVALDMDGRLLASSSYDGTVKLWATANGQLRATLHGHAGGVWSVALGADGELVASGSYDGTVKVWATANGQLRTTLHGHSNEVCGVALSADGGLVASGTFDGTLKLWETASGRLLRATPQAHTGPILSVALSADGGLMASGSFDGTLKLWETASGQLRATLQGHSGGVLGVAMSRDGWLVASSSHDGTVKLWETASGRLLATLEGHSSEIWGVALSADGGLVASGSFDGTLKLWETANGRLLATLHGHSGGVLGVAMSADGRSVASASSDGTLKLWETANGRLLTTLEGHSSEIWGVALSPDGGLVASASNDETVRLWAANGQLQATLHGHNGEAFRVALSADGQIVASSGYDGTVRLWAADSGAALRTLRTDRCYERLDMTGVTGITAAQRAALRALGAVERG